MNGARLLWLGATLWFAFQAPRMRAETETDNTRYSQIVLPFSEAKPFNYYYIPEESAVVLELLNVKAAGLAPIDQYDETLIRKIVIREIPQKGSEVKFFLRDNQVRVAITEHSEPPRLHLDFFDAQFKEPVDPSTGLPRSTPLWPDTKPNSPSHDNDGLPALQIPSRKSENKPSGDRSGLKFVAPMGQAEPHGEPEQLAAQANQAASGRGDAWAKMPFYFYRFPILTARADEVKKSPKAKLAATEKTDVEAMADYAAQLFDLGHEKKALAAYQSVMQRALGVLDQDPAHIWRLGEIHFGMGNTALAEGYYQAVRDKHPDSAFAPLAQLRQLDLQFLKLLNKDGVKDTAPLLRNLDKLQVGNDAELAAQVIIRKAFWTASSNQKNTNFALGKTLPPLSSDLRTVALELQPKVAAARTSYLLSSLVLSDMLQPTEPWTSVTGQEFNQYFAKYNGEGLEPFNRGIADKGQKKIFAQIETAYKANEFERAVAIYQSVPPKLREQGETPSLDMILAESYRKSERLADASKQYRKVVSASNDPEKKFQPLFWLNSVDRKQGTKAVGAKTLAKNDNELLSTWQQLPATAKEKQYAAVKSELQLALLESRAGAGSAEIFVENQAKLLSSETPASNDEAQAATQVKLLSNSIRLLDGAGKKVPAKKARELLLQMKPELIKKDAEARSIWTTEVSRAANDYRKADQFYDAGKAYVALGDASDDKGKAESLYKGGLLLFRAGKRDEAMNAFKRASEDRNDRIYADMAQKRLQQLQ